MTDDHRIQELGKQCLYLLGLCADIEKRTESVRKELEAILQATGRKNGDSG